MTYSIYLLTFTTNKSMNCHTFKLVLNLCHLFIDKYQYCVCLIFSIFQNYTSVRVIHLIGNYRISYIQVSKANINPLKYFNNVCQVVLKFL